MVISFKEEANLKPLGYTIEHHFFLIFSSGKKMEAVQVFIKTEEEEEEKEDVLMDGDQFPSEETSSTEPAELER